jgi:hypothetical protein
VAGAGETLRSDLDAGALAAFRGGWCYQGACLGVEFIARRSLLAVERKPQPDRRWAFTARVIEPSALNRSGIEVSARKNSAD